MALMPFDDRDGSIWINGEMIPWREATSHTLSHGLHYASTVFEGERVYSGVIFKGREHTERLRRSCEMLDFELPLSDDEPRWLSSGPMALLMVMSAHLHGAGPR